MQKAKRHLIRAWDNIEDGAIHLIPPGLDGTRGMNRDRAVSARAYTRKAIRHLGRGNLERVPGFIGEAETYLRRLHRNLDGSHPPRERRMARRHVERALGLLEGVVIGATPSGLARLPLIQADMLKTGVDDGFGHPSQWGGIYNTTLAYAFMSRGDRRVMRELTLDRGYDALFFYVRAGGNLSGLFGLDRNRFGPQQSYYGNPEALLPIIDELREDGIAPIPVLWDNEDFGFNRRDWENRSLPELKRVLRVLHEQAGIPDVVFAIEHDKSWNREWVHPEQADIGWRLVNDAIGRPGQDPRRHLRGAFPELGVWVHFANVWELQARPGESSGQRDQYAYIPNAKGILYQFPWDCWTWTRSEFATWARRIESWVQRDGWQWVPFEYMQHYLARERQAREAGRWISEALGVPAYGTGGRG